MGHIILIGLAWFAWQLTKEIRKELVNRVVDQAEQRSTDEQQVSK